VVVLAVVLVWRLAMQLMLLLWLEEALALVLALLVLPLAELGQQLVELGQQLVELVALVVSLLVGQSMVVRFLVWLVVAMEPPLLVGHSLLAAADRVGLHSWLVVLVCSIQVLVVVLELGWLPVVLGQLFVVDTQQALVVPVGLHSWFVVQLLLRLVELELASIVVAQELVAELMKLAAVCELMNQLMGQRMHCCQHWAGFEVLMFVVVELAELALE
jgi:hypothetical protein